MSSVLIDKKERSRGRAPGHAVRHAEVDGPVPFGRWVQNYATRSGVERVRERYDSALKELRKQYVGWTNDEIGDLICSTRITEIIGYYEDMPAGVLNEWLLSISDGDEQVKLSSQYPEGLKVKRLSDRIVDAICREAYDAAKAGSPLSFLRKVSYDVLVEEQNDDSASAYTLRIKEEEGQFDGSLTPPVPKPPSITRCRSSLCGPVPLTMSRTCYRPCQRSWDRPPCRVLLRRGTR